MSAGGGLSGGESMTLRGVCGVSLLLKPGPCGGPVTGVINPGARAGVCFGGAGFRRRGPPSSVERRVLCL